MIKKKYNKINLKNNKRKNKHLFFKYDLVINKGNKNTES